MSITRFAALFTAAILLFSSPAFANSTSIEDAIKSSSELYEQGRFQEAIPHAKNALAIAEQEIGMETAVFADLLDNLAAIYEAELNYELAQPLYRRALDIRVKVYGAKHPEVIKSLINLALTHDALGEYDAAVKMDARASEIIEADTLKGA